MNRTLIILLLLVLLMGSAIGITLYLKSSAISATPAQQESGQAQLPDVPSSSVQTDSQASAAIQAAFKKELAKHPSDNTKMLETVIAGNYALQSYKGDVLGGEALFKYDQNQGTWTLVDAGGGAWSLYTLLLAHVPRAAATTLLEGVSR